MTVASLYELQRQGEQPATDANPNYTAAQAVTAAHDDAVAKVRADTSLSAAGRAARLAPIHTRAKQQLAELQATAAADTAAHVTRLHRQAFGAPRDPVESLNYRDAQSRAEAINDPSVADWSMAKAIQYGDGLLARAIAARSHDMGWSGPLTRYTAVNPDAGHALNELAVRAAGKITETMADTANYWLPAPDELAHLQPHQIDALAEQQAGN